MKEKALISKQITLRAGKAIFGGYCIGRQGGKVVLIKYALPGEKIKASVDAEKKDYCTASVLEVLEPSPDRVDPKCKFFASCGGCQFQFISYAAQVRLKQEILEDSLKRFAKLDMIPFLPPVQGIPWNYRFRAQFKVSGGRTGFYRKKTRQVVDINYCPVMTKGINRTLAKLRDLMGKNVYGIKEIQISSGENTGGFIKVNARIPDTVFHSMLKPMFIKAGLRSAVIQSQKRDIVEYGQPYIALDLEGLKYTVSPLSFFQSNWVLNKKVVGLIKELLSPVGGKKILDLYSGGGNFSLPLAQEADEVTAVEESPYSVDDGKRNAHINDIGNCMFINSSVEGFEVPLDINAVIVNPPRAGLSAASQEKTMNIEAEMILYLSCNPASVSRDIRKFLKKYDLESVRLVDFFPQTYHIESLAVLRKK